MRPYRAEYLAHKLKEIKEQHEEIAATKDDSTFGFDLRKKENSERLQEIHSDR